ncbi:hypothetical protein DFA_04809 [Cavenderia fasciculata]|uniref:F-box domain-containing protein n=1 Tax=Cavenderia fasciculata TaxID=261658 RepID=F4PP00_CACFS|nr:uncharacterized protein DFA_04809 [Cavenderia fasciculata]EGG22679.1 hypothetical protein DFA_04809 [Cavenderia fasciculata]|eukprot:XP_004360530.1 hypothetical protein DFA_04809 [Cavenderia fasciculata]
MTNLNTQDDQNNNNNNVISPILLLPKELITCIYKTMDIQTWRNVIQTNRILYVIGNEDDIWKEYCNTIGIKNVNGTNSWKEEFIENDSTLISPTFQFKFKNNSYGFHFASRKIEFKMEISKKDQFSKIIKMVSKRMGYCKHENMYQCDERCDRPKYLTISRLGCITDLSKTPSHIGLLEDDLIFISNHWIID